MIIPDEFNALCRCFHQDMMAIHDTLKDAAAVAVGSLYEEQKHVLRRFLDKLFDTKSPLQEAKRAWRRSPAEVRFRKGADLLAFLRLIRHALDVERNAA